MSSANDECSFCAKHKDQVQKLIVSEKVAICNECVNLCQDLLKDTIAQTSITLLQHNDPRAIKSYLDQYVIGQDHAKIVLSVAIVNHYKRLRSDPQETRPTKANILMLGPTGSGKTLLARTVATYLDVPFVIADATSITEAGYVGDDVESLLSRLYAAADGDVSRTQKGIVFIDEIDKIGRKSESASITRDVSGEGVQQAMLKLVEGTVCRIPAQGHRKHPSGDMIDIDTTNILFIAGGAFVGLDAIIQKRVHGSSIGFSSSIKAGKEVTLDEVSPDDLVKYGMIPEFVGRFPSVVTLLPLERADMINILTTIKNNYIEQYQWLVKQDGIDLFFDQSAIQALVDRAMTTGTGARALHSEIERCMLPHLYHLADYQQLKIEQFTITSDLVNDPRKLA